MILGRPVDLRASGLRSTYVVPLGGGRPYPAKVATPLRKAGFGFARPYFTRRTAERVFRDFEDLAEAHREEYATPEEAGVPEELIGHRWDDQTLVLTTDGGRRTRRIPPRHGGRYPLLSRRDWWEVRPRWPGRIWTASQLIRLLEVPTPNRIGMLYAIEATVPTGILVEALELGSPRILELLIRIGAARPGDEAMDAVGSLLNDPSPSVRAEAAHAFEHRGIGRWTRPLMDIARAEGVDEVLELQVRALGTADEGDRADVLAWLNTIRAPQKSSERIRRALRTALEGLGVRADDLPQGEPGTVIGL